LHRGCIGNPKAHDGAVRGIVIDAISEIVVTGSADKTLKFWTFKSKHHISTDTLEEAVCQMVYPLDDFTILLKHGDFKTNQLVDTS
jgi:WD40 repeat protein